MRPVEYLNMTRIDKACELLLREDVAMTDVAHRVGFQTASSFNRNFKRLTGSTPLQWKLRAVREGDMRKTRRVSALKGWEAEDWEGQRGPGKE
jgi:AraC-like DNA-binding protein